MMRNKSNVAHLIFALLNGPDNLFDWKYLIAKKQNHSKMQLYRRKIKESIFLAYSMTGFGRSEISSMIFILSLAGYMSLLVRLRFFAYNKLW